MPVIVMEVLEVSPHPNADALRVYQLSAGERLQVIANVSTVYNVGDHVAIATVGSELKDGTKIRPARLRGVDSFGMALGLHGAPLGSNVSAEFCRMDDEESTANAQVIHWPSIELLHHVRAGVRAASELRSEVAPKVSYRAKVKLDGTNAGVQVHPDGRVLAQSRSQVLDASSDNMGFGSWVAAHSRYFAGLKQSEPLVVFGEWCGPGIQKRAAISRIDRKIFVVFALQYGDGERAPARLCVEPAELRAILPEHPDVFIVPWLDATFELDFANDEQSTLEAERISAEVDRIEAEDPWVFANFGVRGVGEGMVLYPQAATSALDRQWLAELMFKAKGEKHQAVRQKRAAQIEPEVAQSIDAFIELVLPEARLEQGVTEACQGTPETPRIGAFLKWVGLDVQKECAAELAAAGLTWEQVARGISNRARSWFLQRAQRG